MDTEIELKLLVAQGADKILENQFFPRFEGQLSQQVMTLSNSYYDTPERLLRQHDIGLRVRGYDGEFEQTIKTRGQSAGGLHQRPEYNVPLQDCQPDLSLFDEQIWPVGVQVEQLQQQIDVQFNTEFVRHAYQFSIEHPSPMAVEFAYDVGEVKAGNHALPLCELELELVKGSASDLFYLAEQLADVLPFRLGTLSKAARGYMLVNGTELAFIERPGNISLNGEENLEDVFVKGIQTALAYWQHYEQLYLDSGKVRALEGIWLGQKWVLQLLEQHNQVFRCEQINDVCQRLHSLVESFRWVPQVLALKRLRSQRGPFAKRLTQSATLVSYLQGREHGILLQQQPDKLLADGQTGLIQLKLLSLLHHKPWRQINQGWQQAAKDAARDWLQQSWVDVRQALAVEAMQDADSYINQNNLLQQSVLRSLGLAELFHEEPRKAFRAGWLDVLDGIEELYTLRVLKRELGNADMEDRDALLDWAERKSQRALDVIRLSHDAALEMRPYW